MSRHHSGAEQPIRESNVAALAELLRVAIPAIVTMTSYTVMQFVDTWVVSKLGPSAVAAVGNGGIAAFLPQSIMFAIVGVVSTYVSQNLGAGRPEKGAAYAWNGIYLAIISWLCVMLPFGALYPSILAGLSAVMDAEMPPAEILDMQVVYARILLAGAVFTVIAKAMSQYFFGLHKPTVVMISALTGNLINIPLSYMLVLGKWGAPELGVAGAAIGTVIGVVIEGMIPTAIFLSAKYRREFGTLAGWRPDTARMVELLKIGWPAGLMMGNEIFCFWIFMDRYVGHFGVEHAAAGWIVLRYMHLSFMPAVGMMQALTAVVGRVIGAGRKDLVPRRTWLGTALSVAYMGVGGAVFVIFGEELVSFLAGASADPELGPRVIEIGGQLMIVAAAFQIFDAMAIALSGAMRGAGDTVWPGIATVILSWTFILGGGYIAKEFFPNLEALGPWIGVAIYIFALAIAFLYRFMSGAWRRIDLIKPDEELRPRIDVGGGGEILGATGEPGSGDFGELLEGETGPEPPDSAQGPPPDRPLETSPNRA